MSKESALINSTSQRSASPGTVLSSLLLALDSGDVTTALSTLNTQFRFTDHALGLEFTETPRVAEFWQAARELLSDARLQIVSIAQSADCAFAEWKLSGNTEEGSGRFKIRQAISVQGMSVAKVTNGRIACLSEYYDSVTSRRYKLAGQFTEWIEY